jgi:AcrR family transcriptional regulator
MTGAYCQIMSGHSADTPAPTVRARILDAAAVAFAVRGFRGATIDAIARDAGLTRAGLLHYFPSKQHLLIAVLDRQEQSDLDWVEGELPKLPLRDILIRLCASNAQRPSIMQLFTTLAAESIEPNHPGHEWFARRYKTIRRLTAAAIDQEKRSGRITSTLDSTAIARQILAAMDGLQLQWLHESQQFDLVEAFTQLLDQLASEGKAASR